VQDEFGNLSEKLSQQMACCGSNMTCQAELVSKGFHVWDKLLATYALVHTNVPVDDKEISIGHSRSEIDSLDVCSKAGVPSGNSRQRP
jgi:hypothetical protein